MLTTGTLWSHIAAKCREIEMKPMRIVRSVDESMSWVHHALDRLVDHDLCVEDDVEENVVTKVSLINFSRA